MKAQTFTPQDLTQQQRDAFRAVTKEQRDLIAAAIDHGYKLWESGEATSPDERDHVYDFEQVVGSTLPHVWVDEIADYLYERGCSGRIENSAQMADLLVQRVQWLVSKMEGIRTERLLGTMPNGFRFRIDGDRSYGGCWERNEDGTWSQTTAYESPLIVNMSADMFGFVLGYERVAKAVVEQGGVAS